METQQLSWLLMAGQAMTVLFFLLLLPKLSRRSPEPKPEPKKETRISEDEERSQSLQLEERIKSLEDELGEARSNYTSLQNELESAKTREQELNEVLLRQKEETKPDNTDVMEERIKALQDEADKARADYALLQQELESAKTREQELNEKLELAQRIPEPKEDAGPSEKESAQAIQPDERIKSLEDELGRSQFNFAMMQKEVEKYKKKEQDFTEQLLQQKELYEQETLELQSLKIQSYELKNKLLSSQEALKQLRNQGLTPPGEVETDNKDLGSLQKENKRLVARLKELEGQYNKLKDEKWSPLEEKILEDKKKELEKHIFIEDEAAKKAEIEARQKKQKIGEVLLSHNLITKEMLNKAEEYQVKFGGNITQYLLAYGHIDEGDLAQCLCTQFSIPYLPLSSYKIPEEIIKMVPVDLAEKYWLIPVDKVERFLTVVMADPLDSKAVSEVEDVTGCKVRPFVGVLSEIIEALKTYYKVVIEEKTKDSRRHIPFFIDTPQYQGIERRKSIRFKTKIDVNYPLGDTYKTTQTRDISRDGILFESEQSLPVGSLVTLQIDLPQEYSYLPIAAIVQVVRVEPVANNKFVIGAKMIKISKEELNTILKYAVTHEDK